MKQVSLIATISMGALVLVDIIKLLLGLALWPMGITFWSIFIYIVVLAAKCGVGYFFFSLYKKQGK